MKKNYLITLATLLFVIAVNGQIHQATDINTTGDSFITSPAAWNGAIYFEADDGLGVIGDELYKITPDGTVTLVKDINQDPADTSPNSDPKEFTEYKGKLYFNANMGDGDLNGKELWVTDGTTDGTMEVADIRPGASNDANPLYLFVFNDNLYFQANTGTSTQWWRYNGVDAPLQITTLRTDGFATPSFPILDTANNRVFFQAITDIGRNQLHVLKADETVEIIEINASNHGYIGSEAIVFNGSLIFQGDNGTDGDELWISDGTVGGTSMLLDINAGAGNSDPESFAIYNDKLYFVADPGTGTQLWETDGTQAGTKLVTEPNVGGEGAVEELAAYNGKLYFTADNGTNGPELWVYDGVSASMLMDINTAPATGSDPAGYTEVDGLLFFEADDGSGVKLWVTDGTADRTRLVADVLNSTTDPLDVNASEFAVVEPYLFYTADDANGDDIFMVDASQLFVYDVIFEVSDADGPLAGASVTFDGMTKETDAYGKVTFEWVRSGENLSYTVSKMAYTDINETLTVGENVVIEEVFMELAPTYSVTFNVTDGSNPLEGATVVFDGVTQTTTAAGTAVYADYLPATGLAYTVELAGYSGASGTIDIVDADVSEPVVLTLITYDVSFNVTDGTSAVGGADVVLDGNTLTTDASGVAVFTDLVPATGLAYTVNKAGYNEASGSIDVVDADITEDVTLTLITYTVTFNVTDGDGTVEGAAVDFDGSSMMTDASGVAVFSDVAPATGLAYAITKEGYEDADGNVDVDGDETIEVTLVPVVSVGAMYFENFSVYPNPGSGSLNIEGLDKTANYEVYSITNRLMEKGELTGSKLELKLQPGLYILKLEMDGLSGVRKIIIE